jgi:hypothetical protein
MKKLQKLSKTKLRLSKIKTIEKVDYDGDRYDIEVEDTHNFFANGILVHNSSFSCYYHLKMSQFGCMSRSLELKTDCFNSFTEHLAQYDIENKLKEYCETHNVSLCVRGESHGNGRNGHKANVDAKKPTAWAVYSVWDIENRSYIPLEGQHNFIDVANACGFPHVPILERNVALTPELIDKYANSDIGFEGVVVHCNGKTFKIINKEYDSKK